MNYLPTCTGIYFALEESGQVGYIGQNINIRQRWRAHDVQGDLCDLGDLQSARSVRIAWLEVTNTADLARLERATIRRFTPRLNKVQFAEQVRLKKPVPEPLIQKPGYIDPDELLTVTKRVKDEEFPGRQLII
jgi:hypothetical protein